ncbi:Hypothetical predicted protein [Cloeon dipterum]|uniref:Uncharacterized protein n=1 Tax=Cloeon dipterum TaxID=197152 RepID=A0A8S1DPA1_9INSE|nr:Hypothetical predicted protein [Cloeon dipterum]
MQHKILPLRPEQLQSNEHFCGVKNDGTQIDKNETDNTPAFSLNHILFQISMLNVIPIYLTAIFTDCNILKMIISSLPLLSSIFVFRVRAFIYGSTLSGVAVLMMFFMLRTQSTCSFSFTGLSWEWKILAAYGMQLYIFLRFPHLRKR